MSSYYGCAGGVCALEQDRLETCAKKIDSPTLVITTTTKSATAMCSAVQPFPPRNAMPFVRADQVEWVTGGSNSPRQPRFVECHPTRRTSFRLR